MVQIDYNYLYANMEVVLNIWYESLVSIGNKFNFYSSLK